MVFSVISPLNLALICSGCVLVPEHFGNIFCHCVDSKIMPNVELHVLFFFLKV